MPDPRLRIVLGCGLLVGVAAIAVTLSRAPLVVARVNTPAHEFLGTTTQPLSACQPNETLPRGTTAIRLRVEAFVGPRVTVEMLAHGHVIVRGQRGPGWTAGNVTLAVKPLARTMTGVELCFKAYVNGEESTDLIGERTTGPLAARGRYAPLPGRVRVEYLRPSRSSWLSRIPAVARRMGLGRAWPGTWSALLVVALMISAVLISARLVLRESG